MLKLSDRDGSKNPEEMNRSSPSLIPVKKVSTQNVTAIMYPAVCGERQLGGELNACKQSCIYHFLIIFSLLMLVRLE